MANSSGAFARLTSILRAVIIAEIVYLVVLNAALQLPLTQTLINKIKPDKFHVSWENAWTWYPFRAHATGISANGQSRSQQWQVDAAAASGSIAIFPLLTKRVWLDDVVATDIAYRQRPRLKPDKDYSGLLPFFPEIEGREVAAADTSPKKKKRPWRLAIEDIEARGSYSYWIYNLRGSASGTLEADLNFATQGGLFSLSGRNVDLTLEPHYLNNDHEVFRGGDIVGELGFAPFVPRENKGIKLLSHVLLDVDMDIEVNNLGFINLFTGGFAGLQVEGHGKVDGHLTFQQGVVMQGTSLLIEADDLKAGLLEHSFEGEGEIKLGYYDEQPDTLLLSLLFDQLSVLRDGEDSPLLHGRDLNLSLAGDSYILPDKHDEDQLRALSLAVEGIDAPDLALFQHYLPPQWPMTIRGGEGQLKLSARLAPNDFLLDLNITSDEARMGLKQYRFTTDLDFAIKFSNPSLATDSTQLAGSYIKLTDAKLERDQRQDTGQWSALFRINGGSLSLISKQSKESELEALDLLKLLGDSSSRKLLGGAVGDLSFEANVSSLAWISVLLSEKFHSSFGGRGDLQGQLKFDSGLPQPGTRISIDSQDLKVSFLDYVSSGEGNIIMAVDEGGELPDWDMSVSLEDADLKRSGEDIALINEVDLSLKARIEDMTLDGSDKDYSLSLAIESARIKDMRAFNSYLPPDSPLSITSGTAELAADILLHKEDADGWLTLQSNDLKMQVDKQSVAGDLNADIKLVGGIPGKMQFDISGSSIRLDSVKVQGKDENFDEKDWYASLLLEQGETTWRAPLTLSTRAKINIKDSRPIVAMFDNKVASPKWLLKILTIEDVTGYAQLNMADNQIVIPSAHAISDKVEVGAKAVIAEKLRDGVIYARYNKLDAVLKISAGKKNLDVIRARKKYDDYRVKP